MTRILGVLAIALGLVAMAGSYYVWSDYRTEFRRVSAELAQAKVSLLLLTQRAPQQAAAQPAAAPSGKPSEAEQIADLKNRIAILENVWRNPPVAAAAQPASPLPALGGTPPGGASTDCIPLGTRFLLTPNDTYPVCQTKESLTLLSAADGVAVLDQIGPLAEGGIAKLGATNCRVAVMSVMTDGGFAEIRVSC